MKEVITLSESFQVAHRNSHAVSGLSQVGEKSSVRPVNKVSFQSQIFKQRILNQIDNVKNVICSAKLHGSIVDSLLTTTLYSILKIITNMIVYRGLRYSLFLILFPNFLE